MPQGRKKTPFSGKAKKAQLQTKRDRRQAKGMPTDGDYGNDTQLEGAEFGQTSSTDLSETMINVKLVEGANRFDLRFKPETRAEITASKERSRQPLNRTRDPRQLEVSSEQCFPSFTDFPKRPSWDSSMSKSALETAEVKYFRTYVEGLLRSHAEAVGDEESSSLSHFELNLETWRQFWRVIEKSDILLFVVDARYPASSFPPSVHNYVRQIPGKHLVLVLNKVDLIPASVALAWKSYFESKFTGLTVVFFTTFAACNLVGDSSSQSTGLKFRRLRGRISMVTEGAKQIFQACKDIIQMESAFKGIDLEAWRLKILSTTINDEEDPRAAGDDKAKTTEKGCGSVLTLGMLGQPNAGKSSLINALMGKKVVSVSRTPGHTKYFQTIYLTRNVILCDCPGLVFPGLVPKDLQVLMGSFPISQLREPLGVLAYLADRVDLLSILSLTSTENEVWTAYRIAESWAEKRGFVTAKSNRPDVYRAANHILRLALGGKIVLTFTPIGYNDAATETENEEDLKVIRNLVGEVHHHQSKDVVVEYDTDTDADEDDYNEEKNESLLPSGNTFAALDEVIS